MMKTLLSPRWLAGHLLALTLIVVFINLGLWQLRRLQTRRAYNAQIIAQQNFEPRRYDLLSQDIPVEERTFRQVAQLGQYDTSEEVLLRSRAHGGEPGYHLLTPLVFEDNRAILVNRGWVPFAYDTPPVAEAAPPEGDVLVAGTLYPSEVPQEGFGARDPETGELDAVFFTNLARLEQQMPYTLEPHYLRLTSQRPQPGDYPVMLEPEKLDSGSHLGYAMQWFSFAIIGVVGYTILLRSVVRDAASTPETS
jgi:surfeit locus 1 family protein